MKKNREINLCEGSIVKKMILYALPLLLTNVLQLLFNAADVAVLGIFVSDQAVAAVGATSALINLIVGLFVGLSVGANVLIARFAGAGDAERAHKTVGTSVIVSVITGVILAAVGYFGAETFLRWMDCPDNVIGMATKYLRIYFLGMPIMMLYNYCAAILRAVGDTLRPLFYLVIGGVVNVGLNLFFVVVLKKDVEGVAIATVSSQAISAVLSVITISREKGYSSLKKQYLKIHKKELLDMMKIGIPAGLQGCVFSISNVLIQANINSFGDLAVSGNTVAGQFDSFIYQAMYSIALSALAFVSQNLGAGNLARVRKSVRTSLIVVTIVGIAVSGIVILFDRELCSIITKSDRVIDYAVLRLYYVATPYFLCGIMDVMSNSVRGLGHSTLAMIVSLLGSCVFRIIWLKTIYYLNPTLDMVYVVYPVSWALTAVIFFILYFPLLKKTKKTLATQGQQPEAVSDR